MNTNTTKQDQPHLFIGEVNFSKTLLLHVADGCTKYSDACLAGPSCSKDRIKIQSVSSYIAKEC